MNTYLPHNIVRKSTIVFTLLCLSLLFVGKSWGQISYTTAGSNYTQTFDNLYTTVPADNTTVPALTLPTGWIFVEAGTNANTTLRNDNGSSGTGDTYLYGATSSNERALGGYSSGSLTTQWGASFTNNTGSTLTQFTLSYTGEQWKDGGSSTAIKNVETFAYALNPTSLTVGTYVNITQLDFTALVNNTTSDVTLNGNSAANQAAISYTVTGISWAPGTTIYIRWTDINDPGNDDGLAIDNLTFSASGAPATPSIAISSPGVAAGNVSSGQTNVILQQYNLAVTNASAILNGVTVTTAGTYSAADLTNLKVRYSTDATLDVGDATLSTKTTGLDAGSQVFPTFTSQSISAGSTGYLFITADIASGAANGNTINVGTNALSNFSFASGTKTGTDPVAAGGTKTIVAATPAITPSPTSLTGFTYVQGAGPSASQSFTISAGNLTSGGGNITITGSADYEVSTDNTTFSFSVVLAYTGTGTFASNTVYVRLKAGLNTATYNSETISISGGGASSSVTASGSVTAPTPVITPTPTTLTGFTYIQGAGPSASQSFTISAGNLTSGGGNITITGSADYQVSTDNTTFSTSVILAYTGTGTLASNTVYVRLKAGLSAGAYNAESIAISGGGATSAVTASGTITANPYYYWNGPITTGNGPATGGTGTWNTTTTNWIFGSNDAGGTSTPWTSSTSNYAFFGGTAGTVTLGINPTFAQANFTTSGYILQAPTGTTTMTGPVVLGSNVSLQVPVDNTTTTGPTLAFTGNVTGGSNSSLIVRTNGTTASTVSRINLTTANETLSVPVTISAGSGVSNFPLAGFAATAAGASITSNITNNTGNGSTSAITMLGATSNNSLNFSGALSGTSSLQFSAGSSGGAGTVTLSGNSTFTGTTYFNMSSTGVVKLGITNALPATTDLYMGYSSGNGGILDLNGYNETIGNLLTPTTGGVGSITNNGTSNSTLTVTQTNAAAQTFSFAVTDGTTNKIALVKTGSASLIISGTNTYTGGTTVTAGSLVLGKGNILADGGAVTLNGGTFSTGAATGFGETVGTLALSANSTIALGTGAHILTFAASSGIIWTPGTTLTITGWTGAFGATGTGGKIFVGNSSAGLTPTQLSQIKFTISGTNYPATQLSTGEVIPVNPVTSVLQGTTTYATGSTYTFSNTITGTNNDVTFTVSNTGSGTLTISSIAVSGSAFSLQGSAPTTISAGASATFVIRFAPTTTTLSSGSFIITSNSPTNGTYTVNLSGTGINGVITTGSISGSPFCVSASAGAAVSVPFTSTGLYNSGNVYTAQLSDANGSFASPVNLANPLTSTSNSGTITTIIPAGTAAGTGYRIRVVSSNPSVIGNDNGSSLTVTQTPDVSNFSTTATSPINAGSASTVTISSTSLAAGTYTVTYDLSGANTTTAATASVTFASGTGTFTVPAASLSNSGNTTITINTITNGTCPATLTTGNTATIVVVTQSIATGAINGSPFCAGGTSGNTVSIPFTSTGTFASGNTYTAQLSDAGGSFASPVNLANPVTSTANSGTINTTIPAGTAAGTGYRIRVVSSNPAVTGADNGTNLVINQAVTPSVTESANPGTTICAGTSVTFTATAINGGTSPTFDFQVNDVSQQNSASNVYTTSSLNNGEVVTVVLTSNETCITSATAASAGITMTVNPNVAPTVSIAAAPGTTICAGTSVTFTASVTNQGTSPIYDFRVNNVSQQSGASNAFTTTALNNNDVVTVVLTSNATCAVPATVTSNSITITVNPNLTPSVSLAVSPSNVVCAGTSVTFTATPTNGGASPIYDFQVNGLSKQNNAMNTYTTTSLNNGDVVKVVITSNAVCAVPATATSSSITMTVNPNVTPTVSLSDNSGGTFCAGTSVTFTATATNPGTSPNYDFRVDGTSVQSSASNTYTTATLTNGQQVTVILTSNATCATTNTATSNTITVSVTSNATPSVTLAANPAGTICAGTSVTFTAVPTSGGSTPNYDFRVNGVSVQSSTSNTYTITSLADGNTVDVVLTSTLTCTTTPTATSNIITASVTTPVTPSVSIAPSANPVCAGTPVIFTATPTNGGTTPTYQWYLNNNLVNGVTGATYNAGALNNGDQVYAVVTTSLTCVTSATATSTTVTETVNAQATIALSSAPGTDNQSTVQGSTITNITYTVGGSGTGATVTGLPTGVTGTYNAGTFTISGAPTVAGTFPYTVTTTSTVNCNNSANGTLTVCAIPTQDTGITFPTITANSLTASWTVGNGTGRIVLVNTSNSFTNPANSASLPSANPVYGGTGQQVVYNGTGNTVTVTGLDASTTYWFRVYEYNFCSNQYVYDTAAAASNHNPNSQKTSAPLLVQSNFNSVLTPLYMASGSTTRLPVMFRATVTGLKPGTQYRYYTQAVLDTSFNKTSSGAGNPLLVNNSGNSYVYTSGPSLTSANNYDSLTTDASGNYTGWFGFVNTSNAIFNAGKTVYPVITLGNTAGTTLYRRALNVSVEPLRFSTTNFDTTGSFLQSKTAALPKNLVALFDNTSATGRPLSITPVEYIAETGNFLTGRPTGYDSSNGAWNAIIPNNNANGVRLIEQLSVTNGNLIGCAATDADGVWITGNVDTRNPTNGTTVKVIASADDPLATCPAYPVLVVKQGTTTIANNGTYTYSNTVVGTNNDVTFTIQNTGTAALNISSINVSGTGYTLVGAAPTSVAAGSSATFVVRFNPASNISYSGTVTIVNNDPTQPNYILNLSGTGYYIPVIAVSQNGTSIANNGTFTYSNTIVSTNNDVTFTIKNTGGTALTISSITVSGTAYSLQGTAPTTVAANSSDIFVVRFSPPSTATYTGQVTINSNDPNQGTYVVNLTGTGTTTTITTGTVSGSPFCAGTTGAPVLVPFMYTPAASYTGTFTAQLSNSSGSFTSPVAIGTIASDGTGSQTISAVIPAGTAAGTAYRIRVVSNTPAVTGSANTTNLVVTTPVTPAVTIAASPSATVCIGTSVTFTATPANGGSTPSYQWYNNSTAIPGATANTYTVTTPVNGQQVYVILTTSVSCYTTQTATSNTITLSVSDPSSIALTSASGTDAQTVTQNATIANITYAIGGGGTGASVTGLPAGVSGAYNAGVFTISGSPTVIGTFNYTVTALGGCDNNPTATGSITVSTAQIVLADNGMQITVKNITTGSTNNILSTFRITNNLATTATLTQVKTPLSSNYKAADIASFKLYSNTVNNLTSATVLSTQTSTSTGSGETVTFGSLNQTLATNTTYYYWLTADITSTAQTGDSIIASANTTSNFTFTGSPAITGSVSKAGAQIIASGAVAPGLLTVLRIGDGVATPAAAALPVNIYQYNTSGTGQNGTLLKTLPTTPTTGVTDRALTQSATATSEGALNLSVNGRLLTLVGYNAASGTSGVVGGNADVVVGKMDAYTNINTVTSLNRASTYAANNIRSAITVDGKSYWTSGPSATGGIRYVLDSTSSGTGTQISSLNSRVLNITNGQLYVSTGTTTAPGGGIYTVGTGLPTAAATTTLLPAASTPNPYSFVFLNTDPTSATPNLLYVAGLNTTKTDNGIFKYYFDGSSWVAKGSNNLGSTAAKATSAFGITGTVDASGNVVLYVTTSGPDTANLKADRLNKYFDNAAPSANLNLSTGVELAYSTPKYTFGGVAFTPTANGDTVISTPGIQLTGVYRNITVASGGAATLTGNVQVLGSVKVQGGGTLDCGAYTVSSYSADFRTYFSVDSLGTLITSNPVGIAATGAVGSIQTSVFTNATTGLTSRRNFSSGANYIYTAPVAQAAGALPSLLNGNLTINAMNNVSFGNTNQIINGSLTLTSGRLVLPAADTLTLGGAVTHTNGSITANATSNLVLNGSSPKALYFTSGGNTIHNLTINATATTVSLDDSLNIVAGANYGVVICNGALTTNDNLTLRSDELGTAAIGQSAGIITGKATIERFTNGNLNQGQSRRAWRFMTSPVINGQTIRQAWQENGDDNTGYGTLITGENLPDAATAASQGYDFTGAGFHASVKHFIPSSSSGGSWLPLNSDNSTTGTLIPVRDEQAYMLYVRGNRTIGVSGSSIATLRATGSLLQGNQTVPLSIGKFTVVGNPYASSVDFGSLYNHNSSLIQNQFYLWNSKLSTYGAYVLVRQNPDNSGNYQAVPSSLAMFPTQNDDAYRYIPSGSGFFVSPATGVTSGNVTLQESDKSAGSVPPINPFRVVSSPANVRQLRVNLNQRTNDTMVTLADGFLALFSADYDGNEKDNSSSKVTNFNENLGLIRDHDSLIVEARGDVRKTDTLYMKMWNVTKRSYQLQTRGDNFSSMVNTQAWLVDSYSKSKQPIDLAGNITTINFEVNSDSGSWNANRFMIIFSDSESVLPVTITKVSAQQKNGGAEVSWTVSNEVNVKGYTVEKSTDGGRTFATVGTQQPAHNNPQAAISNYAVYDAQPKIGDNYYRIKTEGKDRSITYSEIVEVTIGNVGSGIEIVIYPNPVRDGKINLQLSNLKTGTYLVGIYSGSGQTVYQKQVTIAQPNTKQSEQLLLGNSIAQGSYQIKMTDDKGMVIKEMQVVISR